MSGERSAVAERMVAAAIDLIDQRGEAKLRVADVARQAGFSTAKLYQEFEDREALVIAAQRERFERAFDQSIDEFRSLAARCSHPGEFRDVALAVMSRSWADTRAEARAARLSVVGMALTRPTLLEVVNARHRAQLDQVTEIIVDARRRGFLTGDRDARTVASWVLSLILGRYLAEMGSHAVTVDRWDAIAREALRVVLFGEPVDRDALDATRVDGDPSADAITGSPVEPPPSRLPRARNGTAERILAWAIDQIDRRGEAGLRVIDLEATEGISPTSIYLHFESRDGLVQAAQFARLASSIEPLVAMWNGSMAAVQDTQGASAAIARMIALLTSPAQAPLRRQWLSVLASAHGRPALTADVIDRLDLCYVSGAASLDAAVDSGVVPYRIDAAALIAWVAGLLVGRAVIELAEAPVDLALWDT